MGIRIDAGRWNGAKPFADAYVHPLSIVWLGEQDQEQPSLRAETETHEFRFDLVSNTVCHAHALMMLWQDCSLAFRVTVIRSFLQNGDSIR